MRKLIFLGALQLLIIFSVRAQILEPITWTFSAQKLSANTFQLVATANLNNPWHIYSLTTPEAGPTPTKFVFNKNPLVQMVGAAKETGKLKITHDDNLNVDLKYFSETASFSQVVKVKGNVKTNISGTIEYITCDDTHCLPPARQTFSVKLL